ncbi:hypothetical protein I5168_03625 [Nonlabens sp. SCSIO 43208]|uniref:hypothetical protein n=1 Tax=Nonlabens sp. SCSIO 43208 TaxID=2793009 RepID=UPI003D6B7E93
MKTFEEITKTWPDQKSQPDSNITTKATNTLAQIKRGQHITIAVLLVTALILVAYFIYTATSNEPLFTAGLLLMIGVIAVRIALEIKSSKQFKPIDPSLNAKQYTQLNEDRHQLRLQIHQVWTPVLLTLYWVGFVMLIPTFKKYLSDFWFQYTWISSIPIAIAMIVFIAYQIKKEKQMLKTLQRDLKEF